MLKKITKKIEKFIKGDDKNGRIAWSLYKNFSFVALLLSFAIILPPFSSFLSKLGLLILE